MLLNRPPQSEAQPRRDILSRVQAALTSEPSTATQIAKRARLPGQERGMHATRALARLTVDGLAVSETRGNTTRWHKVTSRASSC